MNGDAHDGEMGGKEQEKLGLRRGDSSVRAIWLPEPPARGCGVCRCGEAGLMISPGTPLQSAAGASLIAY